MISIDIDFLGHDEFYFTHKKWTMVIWFLINRKLCSIMSILIIWNIVSSVRPGNSFSISRKNQFSFVHRKLLFKGWPTPLSAVIHEIFFIWPFFFITHSQPKNWIYGTLSHEVFIVLWHQKKYQNSILNHSLILPSINQYYIDCCTLSVYPFKLIFSRFSKSIVLYFIAYVLWRMNCRFGWIYSVDLWCKFLFFWIFWAKNSQFFSNWFYKQPLIRSTCRIQK